MPLFESIASALPAVTRRNPVYSMVWVLVLFLHVAGIFLLPGTEFLAAVPVIVYASAILIFYIFVVMLLDLPEEEGQPRFGKQWGLPPPWGCASSLGWLAHAWTGVAPGATHMAPTGRPQGRIAAVRMTLFGPFALPFEMVSLLLLAAIIGTVVLARKEGGRIMTLPVNALLALSEVLFGIWVFGFLARRNVMLMLIAIEVMRA